MPKLKTHIFIGVFAFTFLLLLCPGKAFACSYKVVGSPPSIQIKTWTADQPGEILNSISIDIANINGGDYFILSAPEYVYFVVSIEVPELVDGVDNRISSVVAEPIGVSALSPSGISAYQKYKITASTTSVSGEGRMELSISSFKAGYDTGSISLSLEAPLNSAFDNSNLIVAKAVAAPPIGPLELGETASQDSVVVTVSKVEYLAPEYDGQEKRFRVYMSLTNNSSEPLRSPGHFSFELEPALYQNEVNGKGYGYELGQHGYVYPGDALVGYYQWYYDRDIIIKNLTYENSQIKFLAIYNALTNVITPSASAGTYSEPFSVELTKSDDRCQIHYTTDGSEPTINSTVYSDPIAVDKTMDIKAALFLNDTFVQSYSYSYVISSNPDCFIATAAFGSYLDPHVWVLRKFRDNVLLHSSAGTWFVREYYQYSPPIADVISRNSALRFIARVALTPLIFGVQYPKTCFVMFMAICVLIIRSRGAYSLKRGCL